VNTELLTTLPNRLAELLPDDAAFEGVLRVVDLPHEYQLRADIMSQQVVCGSAVDSAS